jgi:YfiH family protein
MYPRDWIVPQWPAPAAVHSLITTRAGGVSSGPFTSFNLGEHVGDDPDAIAENRRRLRALLPAEPIWLRQVHGAQVVNAAQIEGIVEADASVAHVAGCVCAIKIADCMPVLLCDRGGTRIGIAHAGWRGLHAGVIEHTIAMLQCPPGQVLAYLGPAIGPQAFEVGDEVRAAFTAHDPAAAQAFKRHGPGKWLADLYLLARQRCAYAGVHNVFGGGYCTMNDPRFFSYRRDRVTGRMAALIWLEGGRATDE